MTFGVEIEFFITNEDGKSLDKDELKHFYTSLQHSELLCVEEKEESQYIASFYFKDQILKLSNDFCSHLFEVQFPPLEDLDIFEKYFSSIKKSINSACRYLNLRISEKSYLNLAPNVLIHSESDTNGERIKSLIDRPSTSSIYFDSFLMAKIASIHVHFNMNNVAFPNLKKFYEYEYLFPLLFSNSRIDSIHCVRPLLYDTNFQYALNSFPENIPNNSEEYAVMSIESDVIRDYSFVCIREDKGTLEFRGADSFMDVNVLKEIISLRQAIMLSHGVSQDMLLNRSNYFEICKNQTFDNELLRLHYNELQNANTEKQFTPYLNRVLDKIKILLTSPILHA